MRSEPATRAPIAASVDASSRGLSGVCMIVFSRGLQLEVEIESDDELSKTTTADALCMRIPNSISEQLT